MKTLVKGLAHLVRRAPLVVVGVALVLTIVFAILAGQVETETGQEGFAPENEELAASETLSERFGDTGETVMQVLVEAGGDDVISAQGLEAVLAVTAAISDSDAAAFLSEQPERPAVVSYLAPVQQALRAGGDAAALDDASINRLYAQALSQIPPEQAGFVTGLLPENADPQSAAADAGLLLVFLDTGELGEDSEEQFEQLIELETGLADVVHAADLPAGFTAESFSFSLLFGDQDAFTAEIARLFAMAFAIIVLILVFVYWLRPAAGLTRLGAGRRTVADMLLTMLTIVMAITWMNGMATLMGPGYLGWIGGLTEVTQIIPVLLIGLGVDYAIHLTARYREEAGTGGSVPDAVERASRTVGIALVLATATTVVGFLTNLANPVPALNDFGVLAAAGILASFVLMLTFVPAVRLLLDRRAERAGRLPREALLSTGDRFLPGLMARTAVLAERAPVVTLLLTVVVGGGLGAYGLSRLETRFSFTDFVPDDSPVVATYDTITERFGGGFGETTQVLLSGDVATPEAHNALVTVHERLLDVDDVVEYGGRAAAESPVSLIGQLVAGGQADPALAQALAAAGVGPDGRVPDDADVAALYRTLLEVAPEQAGRVLAAGPDDTLDVVRIDITTQAGEAGTRRLREQLGTALEPVEDTGVDAVATSNTIINDVIVTALSDSQLSSLLITLVASMLLLVATFWYEARRPWLGVITIAPVALVVLWTFGMMAATGIPFGPVTATIAALAIGIGVPYTIHITHRYLEDRVRYADPGEAIRSTVRHTGGALAGSAFTTMAGFGILVTSSLTPFRQFGLVTVYAIGFALVAATLVLPSMLAVWDRWRRSRGDEPVAGGIVEPVGVSS